MGSLGNNDVRLAYFADTISRSNIRKVYALLKVANRIVGLSIGRMRYSTRSVGKG